MLFRDGGVVDNGFDTGVDSDVGLLRSLAVIAVGLLLCDGEVVDNGSDTAVDSDFGLLASIAVVSV